MDRLGPTLLLAAVMASCTAAQAPSAGAPAPGATPPSGGAAAEPSGPRTVNSGVYTQAQATRGEQTYQTSCSICHSIGDFTGANFQQAWSGQPLADFHQIVSNNMPQNAPGSLTPQQYADVVAYILSVNGYPAGSTELPTSNEALISIRVEPAR